MLRASLVAALLVTQAGAVGAQNRLSTVIQPSLDTCSDILELEKIQVTGDGHLRGNLEQLMQYKELGGWIEGYLTARNLYYVQGLPGEGKLAKEISTNDLIRWIFYCRANPTKQIHDVALELTETLRTAKP